MDIIKGIHDGVELYTAELSGNSGMSGSGIARSVGVDQSNISRLIKQVEETPPLVRGDAKKSSKEAPDILSDLMRGSDSPLMREDAKKSLKETPDIPLDLMRGFDFPDVWDDENAINSHLPSEQLEPFYGNVPILTVGGRVNGKNAGHLKIYRHDFCAAMIRHFAYRKYKRAQYFLDNFSDFGILRWMQEITGWKPQETEILLPDLNFSRDLIQTLTQNQLSPTAYRLCLHLHKAGQLGEHPTVAKVCKELEISRPTFHKTIRRLNELNILPDWFEIETRHYPERIVRDWLHLELGGQIEAPTPYGPIDLLTEDSVIEVKAIENWKDAIGHVLVKGLQHKNHAPCLMLFGDKIRNLQQIRECCEEFGIIVGFQMIKYVYDTADELLEIERVKVFC